MKSRLRSCETRLRIAANTPVGAAMSTRAGTRRWRALRTSRGGIASPPSTRGPHRRLAIRRHEIGRRGHHPCAHLHARPTISNAGSLTISGADDKGPRLMMGRSHVLTLALLFVAACASRRPGPPADFSGFFDDYSLLRRGGPDDVA